MYIVYIKFESFISLLKKITGNNIIERWRNNKKMNMKRKT